MIQAPKITVIICTLAQAERRETLKRAIQSVQNQQGVVARPFLVINGSRFSVELRRDLERMPGIDWLYLEEGNLGLAHVAGVNAVRTPYFAFLDDDDEFLPDGLRTLVDALEADGTRGFVVGNGIVARASGERLAYSTDPAEMARLNGDPAAALAHGNWLASCGGLYRTGSVTSLLFDGRVKQYEWTYYAFRLCTECRGVLIPEVVFRVHATPGSASTTRQHLVEYVNILLRLTELASRVRPDLVDLFRARAARAYNVAAMAEARSGEYWKAFLLQLRGVMAPGGWHYLPALARIVLAPLMK